MYFSNLLKKFFYDIYFFNLLKKKFFLWFKISFDQRSDFYYYYFFSNHLKIFILIMFLKLIVNW